MAVKTITVTKDAYESLKGLKEPRESFSDTLLRIAKRRPLSEFFGILSAKSGDRLEKAIFEARKRRNKARRRRIDYIVKSFKEN